MLDELFPFLAILNPFALCLYLEETARKQHLRKFTRTITGASLISLLTFWIFALGGRPLLIRVLGIQPSALRLFGGVIFFVVAYDYVTKGYRATAELRGDLRHLPSAIALPFMIGAGTITQSILIGEHLSTMLTLSTLFVGVSVSFVTLIVFKLFTDYLTRHSEEVFHQYMDILARLNALVIGAVSTQMMVGGLRSLWQIYGSSI